MEGTVLIVVTGTGQELIIRDADDNDGDRGIYRDEVRIFRRNSCHNCHSLAGVQTGYLQNMSDSLSLC